MTAAVIEHTLNPKTQARCSFGYQPLWATPHLHAQAQRKALSRAFQFRAHGRATVWDMMPCLEAGHHTALLLCWPWAWRWGVAAQTASAGLRNGCMPPFLTHPNVTQAGHPVPASSWSEDCSFLPGRVRSQQLKVNVRPRWSPRHVGGAGAFGSQGPANLLSWVASTFWR